MTGMEDHPLPSRLQSLRECDVGEYWCWSSRLADIEPLVGPLLVSASFQRLSGITFLGILSPRFAELTANPLFTRRRLTQACDGSRASHSLGVALTALDMARFLGFSELAQKYAVAWGLLHDIGNWPLSHTGEFAFSRILRVTTKALRHEIVIGNPKLPAELQLARSLRDSGLDPDMTNAFLDHRDSELSSELRQLHVVLASALSPDSLEGMWRAGRVFRIDVAHPTDFVPSFLYDLFKSVSLHREYSEQAIAFWRRRRLIYLRFINRPSTIRWESAWSQAILRCFEGVDLVESLHLSEIDIVNRVLTTDAIVDVPLSRYKPPLEYVVEPRRKRVLSDHATLRDLAQVLTQRRMSLGNDKSKHGSQ
jgi:hypothetical protein